ncbi:MAG: MlrC C-terminal domain-containing protein [Paraburkholderia sp.]
MHDPPAARLTHEAGVGARLAIELGGRSATGDDAPGLPLRGDFEVLFLSDGRFTRTGPMWGGSPIDLGPAALLRVDGMRVIVSSRKMQAANQSIIHHVGIDPASLDILVLKSSVHFRADFDALAREVLLVESPGRVYARLDALHFEHAARMNSAGRAPFRASLRTDHEGPAVTDRYDDYLDAGQACFIDELTGFLSIPAFPPTPNASTMSSPRRNRCAPGSRRPACPGRACCAPAATRWVTAHGWRHPARRPC